MKPSMTVTVDLTKSLGDLVKHLEKREVLVGVPDAENSRQGDGEFGNAAIMYVAENGSPANNVVARKPMSTGIQRAKGAIVGEMKAAAKKVLEGDEGALDTHLARAGVRAENSIKLTIDEQIGMAPPMESTLKARRRRGFEGTKSFLVTGQLRNSVTSVVREKK